MSRVCVNISMSLDGFITDPAASVGTPLEGHDPGRLHDWQFDAKTDTDVAIVDEMYASTGAVVMGKGMFDVGFENRRRETTATSYAGRDRTWYARALYQVR